MGNHCGLQRQKEWLLLTLGLILNLCVSVSELKNASNSYNNLESVCGNISF